MSCNNILKAKGYRLTPQRRVILDILHHEDAHLTADALYEQVKDKVAGVDRSTVYRTLDLLESLGLVVKAEIHGAHVYHHSEEGHHHHLKCRACGKVVELPEEALEALEKSLLEKHGFAADLHHHVITGLCAECR
ncbi:Fur family transcriptional regulator, ferric uptake regulator [Dehalogenimonas formicexedens]|uniref:Fur family transcriptional regulator, ferric uptake regulator n=1 Tax=Dehalogenimonas formicexedens TaxID=1839801 RepID=A0A1P8F4T5_9CHLR|nr:Fur family transcriptional regulator [Dehalogenimonas formicexedens]APV43372.1 Fur family transcriptional regulator, ferric uptake regulator [Dehalogenimonas formicexedens]